MLLSKVPFRWNPTTNCTIKNRTILRFVNCKSLVRLTVLSLLCFQSPFTVLLE